MAGKSIYDASFGSDGFFTNYGDGFNPNSYDTMSNPSTTPPSTIPPDPNGFDPPPANVSALPIPNDSGSSVTVTSIYEVNGGLYGYEIVA